MTKRVAVLLAGSSILLGLIAFASPELEPYQYGDIEVRVPNGWKTTVHYAPGVRLLVAAESPDQPDTTPELLWLEATPLIQISPKDFVEAFLAHLGIDYRVVTEMGSASTYEILLEGRTRTNPVKASVSSYSSGDKLYLLVFAALPDEFHELGGEDFRARAFATEAITDGLVQRDAEIAGPGKVWAAANGFELTEKMLVDILAFAEFLASHSFSADERDVLRRELIAEFSSVTRDDYETFQQVGQIVAALPETGPMRRATLRRDLMRDVHFELQKAEEDSALMEAVYRYNPILAVDEELGLIVTRSGYLSLLASNLFVLQRAGLDPVSSKQVDEYVQQLRGDYAKMSEKEKQYLADAEVNWIKLIAMWQSWDAKQRRQRMEWAGVYKIEKPEQVPRVARDLEHLAGFDMTAKQALKIVELQSAISNLEYMRMMIGSYTDF